MGAIGEAVKITGFVTQRKFLTGKTLRQIEALIGYIPGRLGPGAAFATLDRLPVAHEIETFWFPKVAPDENEPGEELDAAAVKRLGMSTWATTGPGCLVKVWPMMLEDPRFANRLQTPPEGLIPHWWLSAAIPGRVAACLLHGGDVFRTA